MQEVSTMKSDFDQKIENLQKQLVQRPTFEGLNHFEKRLEAYIKAKLNQFKDEFSDKFEQENKRIKVKIKYL